MYKEMNENDLVAKINSLPWFHEIEIKPGLLTPGRSKYQQLLSVYNIYFKDGIANKTILDIGCYDGFMSFMAAKEAKSVTANDFFIWKHHEGARECFNLAYEFLGSKNVEILELDLDLVNTNTVKPHDIVLFAGIFYHLENPYLILKNVSELAKEQLIVETHLDALHLNRPAMIYYPGTELNGDGTNFWGPNPECVVGMLKNCGFNKIDYTPYPGFPNRGIFHAYR